MRGDGPVGEAQYRRGPLLGHQVAEGREESPQSRGLGRPFRGMYCRLRCLHRQVRRQYRQVRRPYRLLRRPYRLSGRELTHAPRGPMGMEPGHPAGQAGGAPPVLSRPMAAE